MMVVVVAAAAMTMLGDGCDVMVMEVVIVVVGMVGS